MIRFIELAISINLFYARQYENEFLFCDKMGTLYQNKRQMNLLSWLQENRQRIADNKICVEVAITEQTLCDSSILLIL